MSDSAAAPIRIAGAGPAGLAAAITVARAGRRAIVYERRPDVGRRFHGDLQGLESWTTTGDVLDELRGIGIEPTFEHTAIRETRAFDPDGRLHRYHADRPVYYLVRRGSGPGTLDSSLKAQALAAGVEIRFGEPFPAGDGDGAYVIQATGPRGGAAIVVGYVFETDAPDGAYGALSDHLAPRGYAYLLCARGHGTVASCMFDAFRDEQRYLDRTMEFFRSRVPLEMRAVRRFGGTANFAIPRTALRDGSLLVGEAAGFQDALWGFGMRYAMLSGHLAARALLAGRPREYDRLWQERLGGLLRSAFVNRFFFGRAGARGYRFLLRRLDRAASPRAWLRKHYGASKLKAIVSPLAQWAFRTDREA